MVVVSSCEQSEIESMHMAVGPGGLKAQAVITALKGWIMLRVGL